MAALCATTRHEQKCFQSALNWLNMKASEWHTIYWLQHLCGFINVALFPAYTQIQPNSLVQKHKQLVALQSQSSQRTSGQLLQTASIQPSQHPVPVLPKPATHQPSTPSQQATIFHSTISPHALQSTLNHTKAQPVQLTAINLQIQPTVSALLPNKALAKTSSYQFGLGLKCNYEREGHRYVKVMLMFSIFPVEHGLLSNITTVVIFKVVTIKHCPMLVLLVYYFRPVW